MAAEVEEASDRKSKFLFGSRRSSTFLGRLPGEKDSKAELDKEKSHQSPNAERLTKSSSRYSTSRRSTRDSSLHVSYSASEAAKQNVGQERGNQKPDAHADAFRSLFPTVRDSENGGAEMDAGSDSSKGNRESRKSFKLGLGRLNSSRFLFGRRDQNAKPEEPEKRASTTSPPVSKLSKPPLSKSERDIRLSQRDSLNDLGEDARVHELESRVEQFGKEISVLKNYFSSTVADDAPPAPRTTQGSRGSRILESQSASAVRSRYPSTNPIDRDSADVKYGSNEDKERKVVHLADELRATQSKLKAVEADRNRTLKENTRLIFTMNETEARLRNLEQSLNKLQKSQGLGAQAAIVEELRKTKAELQMMQAENHIYSNEKQLLLDREIATLAELSTVKVSLANAQRELESTAARTEKKDVEMADVISERDALIVKAGGLDKQLAGLQREHSALQMKCSEIVERAEEQEVIFREERRDMLQRIDMLSNGRKNLRQLDLLVDEENEFKQEELEAEIEVLKLELKIAQEDQMMATSQSKTLKLSERNYKHRYQRNKKDLDAVAEKYEEASAAADKAAQDLKSLKLEHTKLKELNATLSGEVKSLRDQNKAIASLEADCNQKGVLIKALRDEISELEEEGEQLEATIQKLKCSSPTSNVNMRNNASSPSSVVVRSGKLESLTPETEKPKAQQQLFAKDHQAVLNHA
eukprot:CAMPEP_0184743378 /NCGR_PEP_ID=MMETSP0315-20130426/6244_1 /TAXON_ID=101924 /ORGANISM="Rhodosorus marinus, Strain UTEX LB 2760" /LENGTH=698 /DNA_ID=CAMNT_0027214611 /DNA_START=190 /DNA_END=2286 /DNA_ORIENTATION=+